jgi:hypothetical protein
MPKFILSYLPAAAINVGDWDSANELEASDDCLNMLGCVRPLRNIQVTSAKSKLMADPASESTEKETVLYKMCSICNPMQANRATKSSIEVPSA